MDNKPNDQLLERLLQGQPDKRLQHLLTCMGQQIRVDAGCIFFQDVDGSGLELVAVDIQLPLVHQMDAIYDWTHTQLRESTLHKGSPYMAQPHIPDVPLHSALLWPLMVQGVLLGVVVLFSSEADTYTEKCFDVLDTHMQIAKTMLENRQLIYRLVTTEAIMMSTQAIARDPSPQNVVNVLRDYLFSGRVTNCMISLFGPLHQNRPGAPFEYIEMAGSWSRNIGCGVGVGLRFLLADYEQTLSLLYEKKSLLFTPLGSAPDITHLDPLTRSMFETDNIQTLLLLLLESEEGHLGVIAIGANDTAPFSAQELRSFQIVAEFLTVSTLAAGLRQQADFVQQGRAALLDAVTDGVIMVLPDEKTSVLTVNRQFTAMFGPEERNVQGLPLCELLDQMRIPASARRALRQQWSAVRPSDQTLLSGEFQMIGSRGVTQDVQWYGAPVYQNSDVLGRIYTFHDITPERAAERLRSELLSRISHELRTPLTSIRGFAQFILESSGDELPPTAREYTEIIHNSAKHLNHLFTDMIQLNRANAGQLDLQRTRVNLADVIIESVARLEPQLRARQQTIVMELDDDLPEVDIDIDRIDQVLTNLIGNAIKYSPTDSKVRISTTCATTRKALPTRAPDDTRLPCIVVHIVDEGNGLTSADAESIFLPFYRTEASRVQKIEGAGLGLAIAQSIVQLHQGKIWAQAATRRKPGGRFLFTIPIVD